MGKFVWAYIGCGGIAHTTAKELIKTDDQQIITVWNRTRSKAEKFAEKFGGTVYTTAEEAITAPGVEGVYIALTYGDIVRSIEQECAEQGKKQPFYLNAMRKFMNTKWSVYMQWNDESFIELFYAMGAKKRRIPGQRDLNYTHYSLEVADIRAYRQEIIARGGAQYLDTEISKGMENTWQFWMHDPDGNKFEVMEYTPESYQVVGRKDNV